MLFKKLPLLALCILGWAVTKANAQNKVSGTISDTKGTPLPYANVILHQNSSKDVFKYAVTDNDGKYLIEEVPNGSYWLEVAILGFQEMKTDTFELSGNKEKSFQLKENSEVLDEVTVKASKTQIRETVGKLIVEIGDADRISFNLQDVMKKVPGVIVMNGNISYGGQKGVTILINGRTTKYMDTASLLKDFPADNIESVELIQQPGAEYDAEGTGPIINVILKKNVRLGTHGNVKLNPGYNDGYEYGGSAFVSSYKNKVNWQLNAGYRQFSWREDLHITRLVNDDEYAQSTISPYQPRNIRVAAGLDYYLNDYHTIGFSSRYRNKNSERIAYSTTNVIQEGVESSLDANNQYTNQRDVFNVSPYYQFKKGKHKLDISGNYVSYVNENENSLYKEEGDISFDDIRYLQNGKYNIITFKGDYDVSINDNLKWTSGIKYATVETDNDLQALVKQGSDDYTLNEGMSNRFIIDERILALYSKITAKVDTWSFSGGVRWEESMTSGTSVSNNEDVQSRYISRLFPSASISKKLSKHFGTNLSYSSRISRPPYSTLNTFVYYYDPFTSEQGNPRIQPELTHNLAFSFTYDEQPFFSVGYRNASNTIFKFISQDNETAQITRSLINLDTYENWNFKLFAPVNFLKNLDGYTGFIVNYNEYDSKELTPALNLSKWSITWFTSLQYKLPWGINTELSGYVVSGGLEEQIEYEWQAGMDFGMSKKFMDDKLKVNLGIGNILNRAFNGRVEYDNVYADIISDWSRQNVYMQITYNFGSNVNKRKSNKQNISSDIENRIKGND